MPEAKVRFLTLIHIKKNCIVAEKFPRIVSSFVSKV
jgi:hypothetical protein